jgi:hypothetical protein
MQYAVPAVLVASSIVALLVEVVTRLLTHSATHLGAALFVYLGLTKLLQMEIALSRVKEIALGLAVFLTRITTVMTVIKQELVMMETYFTGHLIIGILANLKNPS